MPDETTSSLCSNAKKNSRFRKQLHRNYDSWFIENTNVWKSLWKITTLLRFPRPPITFYGHFFFFKSRKPKKDVQLVIWGTGEKNKIHPNCMHFIQSSWNLLQKWWGNTWRKWNWKAFSTGKRKFCALKARGYAYKTTVQVEEHVSERLKKKTN